MSRNCEGSRSHRLQLRCTACLNRNECVPSKWGAGWRGFLADAPIQCNMQIGAFLIDERRGRNDTAAAKAIRLARTHHAHEGSIQEHVLIT